MVNGKEDDLLNKLEADKATVERQIREYQLESINQRLMNFQVMKSIKRLLNTTLVLLRRRSFYLHM